MLKIIIDIMIMNTMAVFTVVLFIGIFIGFYRTEIYNYIKSFFPIYIPKILYKVCTLCGGIEDKNLMSEVYNPYGPNGMICRRCMQNKDQIKMKYRE